MAAGTAVALVASVEQASAQTFVDDPVHNCEDEGLIDITNDPGVTTSIDGNSASFTSETPQVDAFKVSGGSGTNVFFFDNATEGSGFAPDNPGGQPADVSHVFVCSDGEGPTDTTDTGPVGGPDGTDTTDTTPTDGPPLGTETVETIETVTETTTRPSGEVVVTLPSGEVLAEEEVAAAAPAQQLAFTGLSAIGLAIVAGAMLALGLGLRRASRNPE